MTRTFGSPRWAASHAGLTSRSSAGRSLRSAAMRSCVVVIGCLRRRRHDIWTRQFYSGSLVARLPKRWRKLGAGDLGGLLGLDPADEVIAAHRLDQVGMVGRHVSANSADDLVVVVATGHESAFAPDQFRHESSCQRRSGHGIAKMGA